ncbi:MAG TPA: DUF4331 family protein [Acidimicrobiia bacterium]|nr:DUF4331 family protein [Acidimicrobiia bacterium]
MRELFRKVPILVPIAALAIGLAAGPASLLAADHLDAPGLTPPGGDSRLDINDVYAFQSPADPDQAVLIMTTNPAAGALTGQLGFHPDATYEFLADSDGDAKPDNWARFNFDPADSGGQQAYRLKVKGNGPNLRGVTGQTIDLDGEVKVTAGTFDDPFFFDLVNFLAADFACSPGDGDTSNFFLGLNTQAIAFEFPREELSGTVGVWARTMLGDQQIDRMGRPAINTVFIPNNIFEPAGSEPSQRNAFNSGKPQHDQRDFRGEVEDTLEIFYGAGNPTVDALTDILLPDVLTVDFGSTTGFLNGRRLADDVIDAELGLVTNGAVTTDCVGNDSAFSGTFPYLAAKN